MKYILPVLLIITLAASFTSGAEAVPDSRSYVNSLPLNTPVKVGDSVAIMEARGDIIVTPHTLYDSGWVMVEYRSQSFSGDVDICFGFNGVDQVQMVKGETWQSYEHEKVRYVDGIAEGEFTPVKVVSKKELSKGSKQASINAGSLNSKLADVEYVNEDGGTVKATIAYESYESGTFKYKYNGDIPEIYYETYEDWKTSDNKPTVITKAVDGTSKWNVQQDDRSINKGIWYTARFWVEIPFKGKEAVEGKYNVAIKPAGADISQALILDPWYSSSWLYRNDIVISGSTDGAQTDYQVMLLIGETSGATGEDFDLGGHAQTDFDDMRFTTLNGTTLCDYWIESITGTTPNQLATVWVEVPSIDASPADTTIYVYYGNAGASADTDGAATFIKFDDFERGNDGDTVGGSWTETVPHVHISTEEDIGDVTGYTGTRSAKLVGTSVTYPTATLPHTLADNTALRVRVYKEDATMTLFLGNGNATKRIQLYAETNELIEYYTGGALVSTGHTMDKDAWTLFECNNISLVGSTYDIFYNGGSVKSGAAMQADSVLNGIVRIRGDNAAADRDVWLDDFVVRNWTANEPAFSSAGGEAGFPTCALTGAITTATNADILTGGETIILTLTGDTWVTAGATFDAQRQNIIDGMVSAGAEAHGWNNEVKATIPVTDVVRTNDTVVTVTLTACSGYFITANETITVTVPATAVNIGVSGGYVASPTATITIILPLLTTNAASSVEETTATGNGDITDLNGGGNCTVRGFEYDVNSGAPYANEVHDNGSYGTGAYTKAISGLTEGELYYIRAYATSPLGTGYGSEGTFLTKPLAPTAFTAVVASPTQIDLAWTKATCGAGTTVNTYVRANLGSAPTFSGVGGSTIYDSTAAGYNHGGLGAGEHWYYRIWTRATDAALEQYSDTYVEDDVTIPGPPTMSTDSCTGFGTTWAVINGNVIDLGGMPSVTVRGFDYGLTTGYGSSSTTTGTYSTGAYSAAITSLLPASVYHYRAKAFNGVWGYGADATFATQGSPTPYVYYNTNDDAYGTTLVASENWTYQTFTTGTTAFTVSSVKLLLGRVGNPGSVTMSLRHTAGGVPTGADLCSVSTNGDLFSAAYTWQPFDVTTVCSLEPSTMYAIVLRATDGDGSNYVRWRWDAGGGLANGNAGHSNNNGVSWTTDAPADFLFEIWGTPAMEVQDVKIIQSYKATGDWLIVIRYINQYPPYYSTYDVKKYFAVQILDTGGTMIGSNIVPAWGNRVASIYLSAAKVAALDYGGVYHVRLYGLFTGNPYVEYVTSTSDWLGDNLEALDSWVITSATTIAEHDSTTLTIDIAQRGTVLNSAGGNIMSAGIAGLTTARPTLFQIYTVPTQYTAQTGTATAANTARTGTATAIGPDAVIAWQRVGNVFGGIPYNNTIAIAALVVMIIVAALTFPFGHTTAANFFTLPILFAFAYFGFDWIWIGMLYLVACFLLVKKLWIDSGT